MHVYGWVNLDKDKLEVKMRDFFLLNSTYQINQTMKLVHEFDLKLNKDRDMAKSKFEKSSRFYVQFTLI